MVEMALNFSWIDYPQLISLLLFVVHLLCGWGAWRLAVAKGYSRPGFFAFGACLGVLGLLVAGILPERKPDDSAQDLLAYVMLAREGLLPPEELEKKCLEIEALEEHRAAVRNRNWGRAGAVVLSLLALALFVPVASLGLYANIIETLPFVLNNANTMNLFEPMRVISTHLMGTFAEVAVVLILVLLLCSAFGVRGAAKPLKMLALVIMVLIAVTAIMTIVFVLLDDYNTFHIIDFHDLFGILFSVVKNLTIGGLCIAATRCFASWAHADARRV